MSDIKVFRFNKNGAEELKPHLPDIEKTLQKEIEKNLETFFGIHFLYSEYSTGEVHRGKIDTLGIDEDGSPVIIEYKKAMNANVITQVLFYLSWLLDHKAEYTLLVMDKLGKEVADNIKWDNVRLLCIAGDFTKFEEPAIKLIGQKIELIKFRYFGEDLILFDLINGESPEPIKTLGNGNLRPDDWLFDEYTKNCSQPLKKLYNGLMEYIEGINSGHIRPIKNQSFVAFRHFKNFACVEVHPAKNNIVVFVKADIKSITLENGFTADYTNKGHFGVGNLSITIMSEKDLEKAKPLIMKSYEAN